MEANGVTRREFENLARRVERIDNEGSFASRVEGVKVANLHEDIQDLRTELRGVKQAFWTLVALVFTGVISLIVALGSGALGA